MKYIKNNEFNQEGLVSSCFCIYQGIETENLKTLFRSCAMIRPDLAPICENMLMSEGYQGALLLSVKFTTLYALCSALLSPQHHYDWGLRAVKSVLVVAGKLLRANPELDEECVLMRALRDFNTPKIPASDMPIFMRLIKDLFPTYADTTPPVVDEQLKSIAAKVAINAGLQPHEELLIKAVQFQELLDVRHSVMLLGPAGCGKTTIWKTLLGCHNYEKEKRVAVAEVVNPKAVFNEELFGYMTLAKDWKDGCLSIVMVRVFVSLTCTTMVSLSLTLLFLFIFIFLFFYFSLHSVGCQQMIVIWVITIGKQPNGLY